jgi:hypothetical protein
MLPWFESAGRTDAVSRLHRLAVSFDWGGQRSIVTTACIGLALVRWPFRVVWDAVSLLRRYGAGVKRLRGITLRRQVADMARLALRYNLPPVSYYIFRLFEPANAARAHGYLHKDEMSMIYPALALSAASDLPLRLKHRFHDIGRQRGLPVIESLALFAEGSLQAWYSDAARETLPRHDLVFKPVDSAGGHGFQLWAYDASADRWERDGVKLDQAGLLEHCRRSATLHAHILQPRLVNHSALRGIHGLALSTIRMVSYLRPSGQGGVLLAGLRIAREGSPTDNLDTGGMVAPIDLATGRLKAALPRFPIHAPATHHPVTGAPVAGVELPFFLEAEQLALTAHRVFPWVPFIGWDIAITAKGPVLVEANPDWGIELAQIVLDGPLGETLYPDVYFEHFAARSTADPALHVDQRHHVSLR